MAIKRSELIDSENAGYYHLISRCVRRAWLCGVDKETGRDYNNRREWIENRITELASIFSIEVYAYAVLSNHYHLVVYSDPQAPQKWSNLEVAERWLKLYPGKFSDPKFKNQRQMRLQVILANEVLLKEYRIRLGSLSWLMRCINEPIAKRSNAEDFVKGHFWEARFTSQALLDEAAALTCMAYVDLNPIRAGITEKLEESDHTSIQKRLQSFDDKQLRETITAIAGKVRNRSMTIPLKDYIDLVEWTGKEITHPGKAAIPTNLNSTFERLNLNQKYWLGQVQSYGSNYYRFVGSLGLLIEKAKLLGQSWLKGIGAIKSLYHSPN